MSFELQRGTTLGSYELLVRIGRGGMANVWVARGRPTPNAPEQLVAIKAMLPDLAKNMEFRSMFLDEGQIVRSINHPNVVRVYEVGESHGVLYMAMEWVEGDSLHTLIAEANKRRPIPPELAVRMIADTASGLHAAHELRGWDGELQGLVHCDVSPHNILIGLDGAIKLVDFGVAGAMNRVNQDDEAKIRGKFGYMSPEQAQAKPLDRRSDVFSLGIVLFELTTGYRLFRGRDDRHTLDLVIWGKIPRPSQVVERYPAKLESIVMKALERDVNTRYQTADELRDALEAYLVQERILVPGAGVKGLLRRVLGAKIDERRQQIRAALRDLDGSHPGAHLVSDDSIVAESDAISVSVSQVEPVAYQHNFAASSSSGSLMGAARLPTDVSSGAHAVSSPGAGASSARRGPSVGLIVGACAIFGLGVTTALVLRAGNEPPQVVEMSPRPTPTSSARPATAPDNLKTAEEKRLGFSIESLPPAIPGVPQAPANSPASRAPPNEATKIDQLQKDIEALRDTPRDDKITLSETDPVTSIAESVTLEEGPAAPQPKLAEERLAGGFDKAAASSALSRAANLTAMCRRPGGDTGPGKVQVTISPNGTVQNVNVLGKYAGTAVGQCIATQFQRVTVPKFSGDPITVGKSFNIPD